ncbi:hypothetical protein PYW08_015208 [Mythimna loreyi]|uniref:Uncharacterized protein n=1 Tax=Mythimna loreyi TaxID=667449 RepID=A0ACC2QVI0_9NEOP|nr:hypothetical protein PYW08_015208 [Mythimna loreyi]
MYSKIIFVLATACIVNASVLTDKDDDYPETEAKAIPSRCNFRACDWHCRSLNKSSGTCVNGRCKCEESFIAKDVDGMTDPAELLSPGGCNSRACVQQCHRLGFPRGACDKGICKCNYLLNTKVTEPNVEEDSVHSRACNNNRCKQICRKQKFRGGACVGANCYCNKFLSLQDSEICNQ